MGDIATAFATAWRDWNTDGIPTSGPFKPIKSLIRAAGALVDSLTSFESGRGRLGNAGILSLGDVPFDLDPSVNRAAFETIAQRCCDEGKVLWVPKGLGTIDGTIDLVGMCDIDGPGTLTTTGINAPMIRMTVTGTGYQFGPVIKNVVFYNDTAALNRGSAAIEFAGSGRLILYPEFDRLKSYGNYTLFRNVMGTVAGPHGNENVCNWGSMTGCRVYNHLSPGAVNARHLAWFKRGSGTGWTFHDIKGEIDYPAGAYGTELVGKPSYVRIDGNAGEVAGDVLFDGHLTGISASAISVDGGLNYRVNICTGPMTQIDATATRAVSYDPQATFVFGNNMRGPSLGAGIKAAGDLPSDTRGSKIESYGFGEWTGGLFKNTFANGANTVDVCRVYMVPNHCVKVTLLAEGIVGGIGRGIRETVFALRHDGSVVNVTPIAGQSWVDPASPGADFIAFDYVTVGLLVTLQMKFTSSAGSDINWQFRAEGGSCRVEPGDSAP